MILSWQTQSRTHANPTGQTLLNLGLMQNIIEKTPSCRHSRESGNPTIMKALLKGEIPGQAGNDVWFLVLVFLNLLHTASFVKHHYENVAPSRTSFP